MTNQETIHNLLSMEGDCWHEVPQGLELCEEEKKSGLPFLCAKCFLERTWKHINIDLITPEGAFWLLKRLPEWERFEEFCKSHPMYYELLKDKTRCVLDTDMKWLMFLNTLTWLGEDPSALFKALCEFEGLEEERE